MSKRKLNEKYGDSTGSRLGGGMVGSDQLRFKKDRVETGYMGGYSDIADNSSKWGSGQLFPADYYDELDDEDDILIDIMELVNEVKLKDKKVEKLIAPSDDEDKEIEEMSTVAALGGSPILPIDREADGSKTTKKKLKKKRNFFKKTLGWY